MPPPFPSSRGRMTANPLKPAQRYRPGKPIVEEASSSEEEGEEEIDEAEQQRLKQQQQQQRRKAPPKATSFPAGAAAKITTGVKDVKLVEEEDEAGFITEEEEEKEEEAQGVAVRDTTTQATAVSESESEEESSEEEESSSEDEAPKRTARPIFIKKSDRKPQSATPSDGNATPVISSALNEEDEEARRKEKEKTDLLLRDQLERQALARAAGRKAWDDDDEVVEGDEAQVDDTDGLDPAAEHAAWKLRELKRVKREREVIEVAEKEREEIERRRNLTAEEREREDRDFIEKQKEERDSGRGKAGFMQRYFHKGAFFQEELEEHGLDRRDLMGSRFVDEVRDRETLPQYLQVRDSTKIGRKGRTKYKDLRSEDTGKWAIDGYNRSAEVNNAARFGITDERFQPDRRFEDEKRGGSGPTGANSTFVKDRPPPRPRSRSRSRPRSVSRSRRQYSRSRSRSRSPPRRDRYRDDYKSRPRSRSPPSRRDRDYDDDRHRRKRSPSPYANRDKRRRQCHPPGPKHTAHSILASFHAAEKAFIDAPVDKKPFPSLAATLAPDITIYQPADLPFGGTYIGLAGVQEWSTKMAEAFSTAELRDMEVLSAWGGEDVSDRGVVLSNAYIVARRGGRVLEFPFVQVIRVDLEMGVVREIRSYYWDVKMVNGVLGMGEG
ncbi:hypothetical protein AJ80_08384 [Polytolypa hystricis UAMH7299]|uniref:Micro-fibrillar-associated protein 1 C-terminal domain-containing protein n=1 Tax=Polytolypa hystricis (strain UAMH7299) TaxID=1447883 RepID=A0A2B7X922_POLH7|nr:hypothetical protein AJ80_08384 [Polytolypa hystricis UAMH7299]